MSTEPQLPAKVLASLQRGNTLEAIKLLRESGGLGLKEAKDVIDRHLRGNVVSHANAAAGTALPADVAEAMRQGKKIEAIRLLREQTGLGLKEAKEAVEQDQHRKTKPGQLRATGEESRTERFIRITVLAVIALVAYYFFTRPG